MKRKSVLCSVLCCLFFFVGCSGVGFTKRSGKFFDDKVLREYSLSFLQRPQNVSNEREYVYKDTYVYQALIGTIEQFEEYAQSVFALMLEFVSYMGTTKPYAGASSVRDGDSIYIIYENEPMKAYKNTIMVDKTYGYLIFYTGNERLEEYNEKKGGRRLKDAARLVVAVETKKVNGEDFFWLSLSLRKEEHVFLFGK